MIALVHISSIDQSRFLSWGNDCLLHRVATLLYLLLERLHAFIQLLNLLVDVLEILCKRFLDTRQQRLVRGDSLQNACLSCFQFGKQFAKVGSCGEKKIPLGENLFLTHLQRRLLKIILKELQKESLEELQMESLGEFLKIFLKKLLMEFLEKNMV